MNTVAPFIRPTVGRVVWYVPKGLDNLEQLNNDPLKADIVAVHNDKYVNLFVISASGQTRFIHNALLWQGDMEKPAKGGYAMWMPYQMGQAAKTEEVMKTRLSPNGPEGLAPKSESTDRPTMID